MKSFRYGALLAVVALCNLSHVSAQDRPNRGNFNREEFRERMMGRIRQQMDVKEDADWKPISDRVTKVMEARREAGAGAGMGMMFGGRRGGPGGPGGGDGQNSAQADGGERRRGPGGFGGQPSPEAEALQKALEAKAPTEEIKAKLAKFRDAHKAKQEKLEKAQDDLRKVLTVRQEAAAVMLGLLD